MRWAYRFDDSPTNFYDFPFPLIHGEAHLSPSTFKTFSTEKDAVKGFVKDIKLNIPYKNHYDSMKVLMLEMAYKYSNTYPELFI